MLTTAVSTRRSLHAVDWAENCSACWGPVDRLRGNAGNAVVLPAFSAVHSTGTCRLGLVACLLFVVARQPEVALPAAYLFLRLP